MVFVPLTTAETDADSPLDTTLFTKIKDNSDDHQSRINTLEGQLPISELSINWATAGGISQSQLLFGESFFTSGGTSWNPINAGMHEVQIYIPANANSLEYVVRAKSGNAGYSVSARVSRTTGGAAAMTQSTNSTGYVWLAAQTENVSALSGWVTFYIEVASSTASGTDDIYISSINYRII